MIVYEVTTTEQAASDLRGIFEYIAFELLSPENATSQIDRLEENIIGLENFPKKHRIYEKEPWKSRGMRVMPVDNFLVFYITDEATEGVTVIRIMYAGRDVDEQLKYPDMS